MKWRGTAWKKLSPRLCSVNRHPVFKALGNLCSLGEAPDVGGLRTLTRAGEPPVSSISSRSLSELEAGKSACYVIRHAADT